MFFTFYIFSCDGSFSLSVVWSVSACYIDWLKLTQKTKINVTNLLLKSFDQCAHGHARPHITANMEKCVRHFSGHIIRYAALATTASDAHVNDKLFFFRYVRWAFVIGSHVVCSILYALDIELLPMTTKRDADDNRRENYNFFKVILSRNNNEFHRFEMCNWYGNYTII